MSSEEKSAWIMGVLAVATYTTYLVIILTRLDGGPLVDVAYVKPLLWTIGGSIAASVVLHAVFRVYTGKDSRKDQRDKEINRIGEHIGQSFVVIGGVAALIMALLELDHFWIANVLYLTFALSAAVGSTAKVFAYRRGFQTW